MYRRGLEGIWNVEMREVARLLPPIQPRLDIASGEPGVSLPMREAHGSTDENPSFSAVFSFFPFPFLRVSPLIFPSVNGPAIAAQFRIQVLHGQSPPNCMAVLRVCSPRV